MATRSMASSTSVGALPCFSLYMVADFFSSLASDDHVARGSYICSGAHAFPLVSRAKRRRKESQKSMGSRKRTLFPKLREKSVISSVVVK